MVSTVTIARILSVLSNILLNSKH